MKKKESASGQDPFKQILYGIMQKKLKSGVFPDTYPLLLKEIMEYVQQIIEDLEASGQAPEISCASGCHYCCHSQVNILPLEALLIFSFVQSHFSNIQQDDLKNKIAASVLLTCGKNLQQRYLVKSQNPCVFLEKGVCMIYSVRPLICRSWNSLDTDLCKRAFDSEDHHSQIENSPVRNYVFGTARTLFQELAQKMEQETILFDIPHAITCCYDVTDPLLIWARGDQLFGPKKGVPLKP